MPQYAFRAADHMGIKSRGAIEAAHEDDVYAALNRRGLILIDCHRKDQPRLFAATIPLAEQVLFCRHLSALVKAGVPAHTALDDVSGISKNKMLRKALKDIHAAVLQGASLSTGFEQQGARFDMLFVLLLKAGERTGKLSEALGYLHEALAWKSSYATKLKRMAVYPLVQILLAATATLVLLLVAVPQIVSLLGFLGQDMPWYSQALIFAVKAGGLLACGSILLAAFAALLLPLLRLTHEKMAMMVDGLALRLPLLGPLLMKQALARLAQLFSAMLASGVTMNDALQALPQLTRNRALARDLEKVQAGVAGGQGFSKAFERGMRLPPYMVRLLKVGEDGGDLTPSLRHIAALYQQESEQALEAILKGGSLAVTITIGFVLAAIVMGVLYPLYNGLGGVMGQG